MLVLNSRNLRYDLKAYQVLLWLHILPFEFARRPRNLSNIETSRTAAKLQLQSSTWKVHICKIWYILYTAKTANLFGAVCKLFFVMQNAKSEPQSEPQYYLPSTILVFVPFALAVPIAFGFLFKRPQLNSILFNEFMTQGELRATTSSTNDGDPKEVLISMEDRILIYLPVVIFSLSVITPVCYFYDPSFPALMYASLPLHLQGGYSFTFGLVVDTTVVILALMYTFHYEFLISTFMHYFQSSIASLTAETSSMVLNPIRTKGLRKLHLVHNLFNLALSDIIFCNKLLCLSCGILGGYVGIRFFHSEIIIATCFLTMGVDLCCLFVVFFNKAFSIPTQMNSVKQRMLLTNSLGLHGNANQMAVYKREMGRLVVQSIPTLGVKVGSFTTFERESTPIFVEFIFRQIVSLLLIF